MPRTDPRRRLYDTLTWAKSGFSPWAANSRGHHTRAKNPRSSTRGSSSTTKTPGSSVGVNRTSHHPDVGDRDHEPATCGPVLRLLVQNLPLEVPRQQQAIVRVAP